MNTKEYKLYQIDLDLPRPGFRKFISAWLYVQEGVTILVDPGPSSTYEKLKDALTQMDIKKLDALLLTHIHLDHAGAAGLLIKDFPAPIICHPIGVPHLIDPKRLVEGARKVLGEVALDYGPAPSVPASSFYPHPEMKLGTVHIKAIDTPGHAPHHYSFLLNDILFVGELVGVTYPAERLYLRPATPPPFHREYYLSSLKTVLQLPKRLLCLGHYGLSEEPEEFLKKAGEQLDLWYETIKADGGKRDWAAYFDELRAKDPFLQPFPSLPADIQERERFFIANSIKGISALG